MFKDAIKSAMKYTFPVVMSRRNVAGNCSASMGAFVVINREGWIVTAAHIIEHLYSLREEEKTFLAQQSQIRLIESNQSLDFKGKKKALAKFSKPNPNLTQNWSVLWSLPDPSVKIVSIQLIKDVDLAIGKLEPFNPDWITEYPVFKNPAKNFDVGVNLCKIGYPFHAIIPSWDDGAKSFLLPAEAYPFPTFPMDGIFTRTVEYVHADGTPFDLPLFGVETSSPGLKGQSGGPTVDKQGAIWAIQSKTMHYTLGFDPEVPGRPGHKEHQFLNVGLGIHAKTILALCDKIGISYNLSEY